MSEWNLDISPRWPHLTGHDHDTPTPHEFAGSPLRLAMMRA
jgi:hypothetical protein